MACYLSLWFHAGRGARGSIRPLLPRERPRLFSPRGHGVGTWLAGQRPAPADPGAGTLRLSEHRVGGRSVSVLRPDDQLRCKALAGCSGSSILCLQWMAGVAAAPAHALMACAHGRQQTSMPLGSGLLPGPTLRAPRARWDHGQWDGWTTLLVVHVTVLAGAPRSTVGRCPIVFGSE